MSPPEIQTPINMSGALAFPYSIQSGIKEMEFPFSDYGVDLI